MRLSQSGGIIEGTFQSDCAPENPLFEPRVQVRFSSDEHVCVVDAFWDGGMIWKVRFLPPVIGLSWKFEVLADGPDYEDFVRHGEIQDRRVDIPQIMRKGRIQVSPSGSFLQFADGTPFFFMGDTAWNGVLKAKPQDWEHFLRTRREQGFNVIQAVLTQWRAFDKDVNGQTAFNVTRRILINPQFFQLLDAKVAAINRHEMVAALVMLWACASTDCGHWLEEDDAVALARYIRARYGAFQVCWFLGGDGNYMKEKAQRWINIGRRVFDESKRELVTMHPGGQHWVGDEFRNETWFDFIGYQSGHGSSDEHLKWHVSGPPVNDWQKKPAKPLINLEPNYEAHGSYHSKREITPQNVRRALYWSLLLSPTAGVAYGHHGIWPWPEKREVPMDHPRSGESGPWQEALKSEGARQIQHLRKFFDSIHWWKLRPAPSLLINQPGSTDARHFVAIAEIVEPQATYVAYLPVGQQILLALPAGRWKGTWFNPRNGSRLEALATSDKSSLTFNCPDELDWLLLVTPGDDH